MDNEFSNLYYYCPSCNKFHEIKGHKEVSRKLCFHCGKLAKLYEKNTTILFEGLQATQMCIACMKIYDISDLTEESPFKDMRALFLGSD